MADEGSKPARWVLVVDDEKDIVDLLSETLTLAGYRCVQAATAQEAITKLQNQRFHCVLLDIQLGIGSGRDVIRAMRANEKDHNFRTPVLIMSGHLDVNLIQEIKTQVNGIVVKPFDTKSLIDKLNSFA